MDSVWIAFNIPSKSISLPFFKLIQFILNEGKLYFSYYIVLV